MFEIGYVWLKCMINLSLFNDTHGSCGLIGSNLLIIDDAFSSQQFVLALLPVTELVTVYLLKRLYCTVTLLVGSRDMVVICFAIARTSDKLFIFSMVLDVPDYKL